jgi:hypothetical protein
MKKKICWHVFADNLDEYVQTLREANEIWKQLKSGGETNIRIYRLSKPDKDDDENPWDEEFYRGIGGWPQ